MDAVLFKVIRIWRTYSLNVNREACFKGDPMLLSNLYTWDFWPKRKWLAMCDANRLKMKKEKIFISCLPSPPLSCIITSQLVGILFLKLQMWGSFIILVISTWLLMPNLIFAIYRSPKFILELRWNYLLCFKSTAGKVLTNWQVY